MLQSLIALLETYELPVHRQGSFSRTEEYPKAFFTWWNPGTEDISYYDNTPDATVWDVDVNFYSVSPKQVYDTIDDVISKMKKAGWIISGRGYDVASDEPTHFGRGFQAVFRETNKTN